MVVSAIARSIVASMLLAWARLVCWSSMSVSAVWFQVFQMGAALQNLAAAVWSGVRVVLESWPMLVTSARTAVYPGVFIGGGGAGRNWLACSSRNGRTDPQLVNIGGPNFGGVRRYAPGAVPATNAAGGVA